MTLLALGLVVLLGASGLHGSQLVERRLWIMGTSLEVVVEGEDREAAVAGSEAAIRALEETEARLSTWREESELSRLNRASPSVPVLLSPELWAELSAARRCWEETDGAFDPGIGALVHAWRLREGGGVPSREEREAARTNSGLLYLRLLPQGMAIRERAGLWLEEGGFGKGAGLDRALATLRKSPGVVGAYLNLGGQVAVYGPDGPWEIQVAHPRDRQRAILTLTLPAGSVATSGNSERGLEVAGVQRSHILDPRTGEPAADFGSLTVWAQEALWADCLSTGLYVLGPDRALAWAARHPRVEVLVVETGGGGLQVRASRGFRGRLVPLLPEVRVSYWEDESTGLPSPGEASNEKPGAAGHGEDGNVAVTPAPFTANGLEDEAPPSRP